METQDKLKTMKRRLAKEINSRKQAEAILELKTRELHQANAELRALNENLEQMVQERTKALMDSELRYRQLVETATEIIYRADAHGYFSYANPQAETLLGYSNEELIGKHFLELIPDDWKQKVFDFYKENKNIGESNTYLELPVLTKSGQIKWLSQNVRFIVHEGKITEAAAVARDITKRKMAEDALQSTQLRLSHLIANLQSGILVEDEQGKIVLANEFFCKLFHIPEPPQALVGMQCSRLADQAKDLFREPEKFAQRTVGLLAKRETVVEEQLELSDGRILQRDYIPIFEGGKYLGHLWQYRDVTEEFRASDELRRSEEKYRGIIENMELGLMELDNLGRIVRAYRQFCEMTGYQEEEILGQKAVDLFVPKEFLPVIRRQELDRMRGNATVYEIEMLRKNGTRFWVMISGAPIYNKWGSIAGSIGIYYDVSKQKRLQQELFEARLRAESAQEAEKQFLANMSHEIRTPLNAIIGMAHLLYDTNPTPEQHSLLDILRHSSEILHALINDLLDIAKIKADKMEVNPKPFDLSGLLRTLQKTFKLKMGRKAVEVEAEIDHHLNTILIGDDLMLNQILMNLMSNAEKFTESGKIGMRVSQKERNENMVTVRFEVYDTGIGIPADKLDSIFQSFRQVDGDIKRRFGGTGLGLSIVEKLIELQGGSISVSSQVGVGTVFTFELAYEDTGKAPMAANPAVPRVRAAQKQWSGRVLIVEDNSMNRSYLATLFDKWNIPCQMAVNGKEGFEMAQREAYQLILMDIQMPEMDGYEAAIAIRSTANPNRETPILALTASAMLSRKDMAFQVGMNGYISKPFTPEQLLNSLEQFIPIGQMTAEPLEETGLSGTDSGVFAFSKKLDAELLHNLYGYDTAYALDMFDAFVDKMKEEYPVLQRSYRQGDLPALAKYAHKLKPTFPMVGLTGLEKFFQQLEDEAKSQPADTALIGSILEDIEEKVKSALALAESERERLRSFNYLQLNDA